MHARLSGDFHVWFTLLAGLPSNKPGVAEMASASIPRVLAARALSTNLIRAIRSNRAATLRTWSPLSVASFPAWKQQEWARPTANRLPDLSPAQRWSSAVSYTVPQLEEQVLAVLKMFDKVKPEKVRQKFLVAPL